MARPGYRNLEGRMVVCVVCAGWTRGTISVPPQRFDLAPLGSPQVNSNAYVP